MTRTNSHRNDPATQPPIGNLELDAYFIDDEFDNFLDRELFAIRESLADSGNF